MIIYYLLFIIFFERERGKKYIKKYIRKKKSKYRKVLKRKSHFFALVKCGDFFKYGKILYI
jgi:hypothetical protein